MECTEAIDVKAGESEEPAKTTKLESLGLTDLLSAAQCGNLVVGTCSWRQGLSYLDRFSFSITSPVNEAGIVVLSLGVWDRFSWENFENKLNRKDLCEVPNEELKLEEKNTPKILRRSSGKLTKP